MIVMIVTIALPDVTGQIKTGMIYPVPTYMSDRSRRGILFLLTQVIPSDYM